MPSRALYELNHFYPFIQLYGELSNWLSS